MDVRSAIRLFHRNVDVDQYNYDVMNDANVLLSLAKDEVRGYVNVQQLKSTHDKLRKMDVALPICL